MVLATLAIVWTLCSGFAALIAHNQGRDPGWYAVAGLLTGPIGLLCAAFATPGHEIDRRHAERVADAKARAGTTQWMDADGR
jgi:hypothetical protein